MNIENLKLILLKRISHLSQQLNYFSSIGDLAQVINTEKEISDTQDAINKLNS